MTEGVDDRARLNEIRERAEAATEGPWSWHFDGANELRGINVVAETEPREDVVTGGIDGLWPLSVRTGVKVATNASFIAHARSDVPWLVDALEKSWAENVACCPEHCACADLRAERDAALAEVARLRDALGVIEGGVIEGDVVSRWTEADPRHPVRALARAVLGGGSLAATPNPKDEGGGA